jgi:hypothetical protein
VVSSTIDHGVEMRRFRAAAPPFDHPLPNLLELTAEEILAHCCKSQQLQFTSTLHHVRHCAAEVTSGIPLLRRYLACYPSESLRQRLSTDALEHLFLEMHDHVMAHPVWLHPFFVRIAAGDINLEQLKRFARHYFNQVKNTRQCVALALGRFHTMLDRPDGELNVVLSELTQVVLAGLLADEYGSTGAHGHHPLAEPPGASQAVDIAELFSPITHPELFRRFQHALGETVRDYDASLLHGVADNVLVQRILSGDPAYDELEALASVGLGMEWGVPAFFSMIMAGILKVAPREGLALDGPSMEIWSAHVQQDVEHAIAVMVATGFYVNDAADVARIANATNVLMAFRYNMMSDIYSEVFGVRCRDVAEIDLEARYFLNDRRIEPLLAAARKKLRPGSVRDYDQYVGRRLSLPVRSR